MRLWESPHFEIVPSHGDFARFDSVAEFLRDQKLHGYYGGMRLIKAAVSAGIKPLLKIACTVYESHATR